MAEIRKAKKSFEKELSKNIKGNPKSFYAYVHSRSKSKSKVGPFVNTLNMQVEDEERICEIINENFSSEFTAVFTSERLEGLTVCLTITICRHF